MSAGNPPTSGTQRRTGSVRVAVTGAGGFVGGAVAADLEAAGHRVVRLARRPVAGHPETVLWDLRQGYLGDAPLPAVDAIVHCAAAVATVDADHTMREANVGGSVRIADAWPGVLLVFMSSVSVYPPSRVARGGAPLRVDDAAPGSSHDAYSRSKWDAEQALTEEAARTGRPLTILRASIVYGPGDPLILPSIRRLRFGRLVVLPGGKRPWSMTPVGLLSDVTRACIESPTPGMRVLNVAESPPERVRDLFRRLLEEDSGRRLIPVPIPAWPVRVVATCLELGYRAFRPGRAPILSRSAVTYITEERILDLTVLRTLAPRTPRWESRRRPQRRGRRPRGL